MVTQVTDFQARTQPLEKAHALAENANTVKVFSGGGGRGGFIIFFSPNELTLFNTGVDTGRWSLFCLKLKHFHCNTWSPEQPDRHKERESGSGGAMWPRCRSDSWVGLAGFGFFFSSFFSELCLVAFFFFFFLFFFCKHRHWIWKREGWGREHEHAGTCLSPLLPASGSA